MPDTEHSDDEEKRRNHSDRPLTEEEWIELMNSCDRLSQYVKNSGRAEK